MAILNKEKRIRYLGFNDLWFGIVGVFIISNVTNYLFNNPFERPSLDLILIGWFAALFVTLCDWLIIRAILIRLRIRFPDLKDDFRRIVLLLLSIVASIMFVDYAAGALLAKFFSLMGYYSNHITNFKIQLPVIIITIMIMAIYEAIYYYNRLKKSIREEEQTKQIMIQAQLDTLRNQAQPHFLFNSLNTLRDIIDQESKDDAKGFVDQLAHVYRFILESGKTNLISIEKELEFAKAYVYIQKERFGENLKIRWNISDDQLTSMVVPMSLQLLLENAIKHNVVSKSKPLVVHVETNANHLIVSNKIQPKSTKTPSTKIGLKNIEKRYQLISDTSPTIAKTESDFIVSLPLLKPSVQNKNHANTHH